MYMVLLNPLQKLKSKKRRTRKASNRRWNLFSDSNHSVMYTLVYPQWNYTAAAKNDKTFDIPCKALRISCTLRYDPAITHPNTYAFDISESARNVSGVQAGNIKFLPFTHLATLNFAKSEGLCTWYYSTHCRN